MEPCLAPRARQGQIIFSRGQVADPVYSWFQTEAAAHQKTANLYLVRAVSGAGKTGTILNAIGRHAFLFYVQCDIEQENRESKDYVDTCFKEFHRSLRIDMPKTEDKEEKTVFCRAYCQTFWLCRLMLLEAMQNKYPDLTPEQWIWWTNSNNGQQVLSSLQNKAFYALRDMQSRHSWIEISKALSYLMAVYCEQFPNVWFAVDEAPVIQTCFEEHLVSGEGATAHANNLLNMLIVQSLPQRALALVAGTRVSQFEKPTSSHGGKGSSLFKLSEVQEAYPYVTPDEAISHLSEWINLDGISEENLQLARSKLQGRLRYVFAYLRFLYMAASRSHADMTNVEQKNKVFVTALNQLLADLEQNIYDQWKRVIKRYQMGPRGGGLVSPAISFPEHILTVLMAFLSGEALSWEAEYLTRHYGFAPEETGFLYFYKVPNPDKIMAYRYIYSIKEPQLVPFVINMLGNYFPQKALNSLSQKKGAAVLSACWEFTFGIFMMAPKFYVFLSKHSEGITWCKNLKVTWDNVDYGNSISELQHAMNKLVELTKIAAKDRNDVALQKGFADLIGMKLFHNYPNVLIPDEDIELLLEIGAKYQESESVAMDLLFMFARPTTVLLRPSVSMGPDLVGFCKTADGNEVLVLVSLSFTPTLNMSEFKKEHDKNKYKQEPEYFYTQLTKEDEAKAKKENLDLCKVLKPISAKRVFDQIGLPTHTLMLHVTMPNAHKYQKDVIDEKTVRIYINQSNLKDFSAGLDEILRTRLKKLNVQVTEYDFNTAKKISPRRRF